MLLSFRKILSREIIFEAFPRLLAWRLITVIRFCVGIWEIRVLRKLGLMRRINDVELVPSTYQSSSTSLLIFRYIFFILIIDVENAFEEFLRA